MLLKMNIIWENLVQLGIPLILLVGGCLLIIKILKKND